jgi:hypothetical protein
MINFKLKTNREIDYIKHSTRYNQKSTSKETVIKFRKKT